jgi:hypothetical protein
MAVETQASRAALVSVSALAGIARIAEARMATLTTAMRCITM